MLPAARVLPIPTTTTDIVICGGAALLHGWAWLETTGSAAAEINLYDGSNVDGALVTPISLSAGQSTRDWLAGAGIGIRTGLFLEVVSGSVRGSIWLLPASLEWPYELAEGAHPLWAGHD